MAKALLLVDPSTQGRSAAGVKVYSAIQDSETASMTTPATARCPSRRRSRAGAATRYPRASAGTTIQAWSILAWKPRPTHTAAQISERSRASITASW